MHQNKNLNSQEKITKSYSNQELKEIVIQHESIKPYLSRLREVTNTGEKTALSHVVQSAIELLQVNDSTAANLIEEIRLKLELPAGSSAIDILNQVNTDIIGMQQVTQNVQDISSDDPLLKKLDEITNLYSDWTGSIGLIDRVKENREEHITLLGLLAEISHSLGITQDISPSEIARKANEAIKDEHLTQGQTNQLQKLALALDINRGNFDDVISTAVERITKSNRIEALSERQLQRLGEALGIKEKNYSKIIDEAVKFVYGRGLQEVKEIHNFENLFSALSIKPLDLVTSIIFDLSTNEEITVDKRKLHSAMLALIAGSNLIKLNGSTDEFIAWAGMIGRTHCPTGTRVAIAKDLLAMISSLEISNEGVDFSTDDEIKEFLTNSDITLPEPDTNIWEQDMTDEITFEIPGNAE